MELKDVQFETLGEAAKSYPQSTLVIRKQFFDGVVARFQDTIKTRTEMLVDEQKLRIGIGQELQKVYHKTFELEESIRKQKYWRCLATILVNAKTGEYFFASEYLKSHSDKELFHELAYGHFVHEEKWNGKKKDRNNEQQNRL